MAVAALLSSFCSTTVVGLVLFALEDDYPPSSSWHLRFMVS
jgi:F0F1-type ATP synthase assembly protein I